MNNKLNVMFADDDMLVRTSVSIGLTRAGFNVTLASGGYEALSLANENDFDVVLLDICMPDLSGIQVAKQLDLTSFPVLFFTANLAEEYLSNALCEGSYGYLVKPMDIHQIIPAITIALENFKKNKRLLQRNETLVRTEQANRNISVAVGLIMERHHISEEEAFNQLRSHARNNQKSIKELSSGLVETMSKINQMCVDL